jgi:hypothetical protein
MHKLTTLILLSAFAQAAAVDKPFDPEARARAIAPYLDAQMLALAHLDLAHVDMDAIIAGLTGPGPADEDDISFRQAARQWVADFVKAGGKDVYAVLSAADYPSVPFLIVPLADGADSNALAALLSGKSRPKVLAFSDESVENLDHALFVGSRAALARLRTGKPSLRPEVAAAFAGAGDTAVQVLLLPTADAQRIIEEVVPTLARELGGGPSTILTHGVQWAALGLDGPPKALLRLVIQSRDAAAARALHGLTAPVYDWLGRAHEVREFLPEWARLAPAVLPSIKDDQLVLTLDNSRPELGHLLTTGATLAARAVSLFQAAEHLQQIGLALHRYHDTHHHFPAVANFDKDGKPLLSWRVHLLPFLDQGTLYKEFHLDEPWNSEHNKQLIAKMPDVYQRVSPKLGWAGKTTYLAPVGEALVFTGGPQPVERKNISDGTSNTIMVVDADEAHAVIWTRPEDLKIDPKQPGAGFAGHHGNGFSVVFADAAVHFLPKKMDKSQLYAFFTRNGGEVVSVP